MVRHVVVVAWVAALASSAACTCGGVKVNQRQPQLLADRVIRFPDLCPGDTLSADAPLHNVGGAPLNLTNPRFTDGTPRSFAIVSVPSQIFPGGDDVVTLTATGAGEGHLLTRFVVDTDDPAWPSAHFNVAAFSPPLNGRTLDQARREVHALCDDGNGFGDCGFLDYNHNPGDASTTVKLVAGSAPVVRTATLTNKGCGKLQLREVKLVADTANGGSAADVKLFTVLSPSGATVLAGGASVPLTVQFSPPAGVDSLPNVRVHVLTDDPVTPDLSMGLLAEADAPAMLVEPQSLEFYDASQGAPAKHAFTITNRGTAALTVTTLALDTQAGWSLDAAVTTPFTLTPSQAKSVGVTFAPQGAGGSSASVTVTALDGETATVKCYGGGYPQLGVTWLSGNTPAPPPIDFGTVATGAKDVERTVQLTNLGHADLHVTKLELAWNPGNGYSLKSAPPLPLTLPAGQNAALTIAFDDNVLLRDDPAKLGVVSDDPLGAPSGGEATFDVASKNDPNYPPVASLSVGGSGAVGSAFTLDASGSTDPEPADVLTYAWKLRSAPQGSAATLSSTTGATVTLKPDVPGPYVVSVTVADQFGSKDTATARPVAR